VRFKNQGKCEKKLKKVISKDVITELMNESKNKSFNFYPQLNMGFRNGGKCAKKIGNGHNRKLKVWKKDLLNVCRLMQIIPLSTMKNSGQIK
jgi:hypothetical protein